MKQYIDKAAVVAEIERRKQELHPTDTHKMQIGEKMDRDVLMWLNALNWIKKVIDTLEMKEEPVSNGLEQAANDYVGHAPEIDEDLSVYSNREAFKAGAQWQKEQMIDKACEFLKSYRQDTPDGIGYIAGIVDDKTIEEFKQAMKDKL